MLESLILYVNAQKWVAIHFIILGLVLLFLTLLCIFVLPKSALVNGLKWGFLATGILILLGGVVYINFNKAVGVKGQALYEKSAQEFVKLEHERMEKVSANHDIYQVLFALALVGSIIIMLFFKPELLKGLAFAFAFFMLSILLIEVVSYWSISEYTNTLREETKK